MSEFLLLEFIPSAASVCRQEVDHVDENVAKHSLLPLATQNSQKQLSKRLTQQNTMKVGLNHAGRPLEEAPLTFSSSNTKTDFV